jgi:hypothetical protein
MIAKPRGERHSRYGALSGESCSTRTYPSKVTITTVTLLLFCARRCHSVCPSPPLIWLRRVARFKGG